jgi:hypothetical protein
MCSYAAHDSRPVIHLDSHGAITEFFLVLRENPPKSNSATRPKQNFDPEKNSADQSRTQFESRSTFSGLSKGRIGVSERGKLFNTAQFLNLVARLFRPGFEATRRTDT